MSSRHLCCLAMLTLLVLISIFAPSGAQTLDEKLTGPEGSADAYYRVRADSSLCIAPLCGGGFFVELVNELMTPCADGLHQPACYVADVDYTALSLSETELDRLLQAVEAGKVLFKGHFEPDVSVGLGYVGSFMVSEAWIAASDNPAAGTYYRVTDNGCQPSPCPGYHTAELNAMMWRDIDDVDLTLAGAAAQQIDQAYAAMTLPDGVIVAGTQVAMMGPAGMIQVLVGSQFYMRLLPSLCQPTGCSGQICAEVAVITTCEWRPEYACYQTAVCERQVDGQCGWTETPDLLACLDDAADG